MAATKLLIVESPSKAKTIKKYLGSTYLVRASVGHVRDLPASRLGINVEKDFEPTYQTIKGKGDILKELRKLAKGVKTVYIATDPDREGEAIAFHLYEVLKKYNTNINRVLFNEITKTAVKAAIKNCGKLDDNKVNAQQTRRMLDRIVGYKLSPLLWKKIMKGLSAGRVQSVATKIVVDREKEIDDFKPVEYWVVKALMEKEKKQFNSVLTHIGKKKLDPKGFRIENKEQVEKVEKDIKGKDFEVIKLDKKKRKQVPPPPYITSKLQQDAANRFKFPPKKTMGVAQKLYEGKDIGSYGTTGLITYMRTDSTRISDSANSSLRDFIEQEYGKPILTPKVRKYNSKKGAQDAHEAIRPTNVELKPDDIKSYLTNDEYKLYKIIWERFVATQMKEAIYEKTVINFGVENYKFHSQGEILVDKGFLEFLPKMVSETTILPNIELKEKLTPKKITTEQKFTQAPPRYSEATIIRKLEEVGIGRPSTYATIVSTIQDRNYVVKKEGKFIPSEMGKTVTKQLTDYFPEIINVEFTSNLEKELDLIEEGDKDYIKTLKNFYDKFIKLLDNANENMPSLKPKDEKTGIKCDKCDSEMVIKTSMNGKFLACSGYPNCKNTKNFEKLDDGTIKVLEKEVIYHDKPCPKCGKKMIFTKGPYGDYYRCEDYPKCKTTMPVTLDINCPKEGCDGKVVHKKSKKGKQFFSCSNYPKCDFISWNKPVNKECPECKNGYMVEKYDRKTKKTNIVCPNCNHKIEKEDKK